MMVVVVVRMIPVKPGRRTHPITIHARSVRFESHTEHFAPLCKWNPSRFKWPVEEVVDERPTAWARWVRQGRSSTTTEDQERYCEYCDHRVKGIWNKHGRQMDSEDGLGGMGESGPERGDKIKDGNSQMRGP